MNGIPFEQIREAALAQAARLLHEWFPHGKIVGREFKIGNLAGEPGDSLSVNLFSGKWADFGDDPASGFDLVDLRAQQKHGGCRVGAALDIAEQLGIPVDTARPNGHHKRSRAANWHPMVPPPEGTPPPPDRMFSGVDIVHEYTDASDRVTHYVRRIEARNSKKKDFWPLTSVCSTAGEAGIRGRLRPRARSMG